MWAFNFTDTLLGILSGVIGWILELLPEFDGDDLIPDQLANVGGALVDEAAPVRGVVPIEGTLLVMFITVTIVWPALLVYVFVFWCYKHLPFLGKG